MTLSRSLVTLSHCMHQSASAETDILRTEVVRSFAGRPESSAEVLWRRTNMAINLIPFHCFGRFPCTCVAPPRTNSTRRPNFTQAVSFIRRPNFTQAVSFIRSLFLDRSIVSWCSFRPISKRRTHSMPALIFLAIRFLSPPFLGIATGNVMKAMP
jgi:hypothetical protein